jgi:hypothetical protein
MCGIALLKRGVALLICGAVAETTITSRILFGL